MIAVPRENYEPSGPAPVDAVGARIGPDAWRIRQSAEKGAICADRRHRLEAIHRWYHHTWIRLDTKVKASIVEGVTVFLSLFDENPAVYRAFCPPRAAYARPPKPGEPRPLPRSTTCSRPATSSV